MRLYNTLTRSIQDFQPLKSPTVTMYVCGPTVYDEPHLGHLRSAYVFDVLRRWLEYSTFNVTFVRNVTDVDDKIIQKSQQTNQSAEAVSQQYLAAYHQALARLDIHPPTHEPCATQHIDQMLDMISKLLVHGMAYETKSGDAYFSVRKFPPYGRLSNRTVDELQAGTRVEPGEDKQDPLDFALWKAAKPGEPSWKSPWGAGRPGWHIECSAMSTHYLGETFDIHGGGLDLIFPHHENEIAQAQAVGKPFAKYWVHHGLVTVNGEKMSKSLGNYLTIGKVLEQYPHPDYLKLFFLKTHYRSPIDYSSEKIDEARKNWQEFLRFFQLTNQMGTAQKKSSFGTVPNFENDFCKAMDDDLNTPRAIAVLFDVLAFGQKGFKKGNEEGHLWMEHAYHTILECGMTLGLFRQGLSEENSEVREHIQQLISHRDELRKEKKFKDADDIREQLKKEGYQLMDTSHGTLWHRIL